MNEAKPTTESELQRAASSQEASNSADDSELARAKRLVKYPKAHREQRHKDNQPTATKQERIPGAVATDSKGRQEFPHEKFGASQVHTRSDAAPGAKGIPATQNGRGLRRKGQAGHASSANNTVDPSLILSPERRAFPHEKFGTMRTLAAGEPEMAVEAENPDLSEHTPPEQGIL